MRTKKVKTFGDEINRLVKIHYQLYLDYTSHPIDGLKMTPVDMATFDLRMKLFVYERALEQLKARIAANQSEQ